MPFKSDETLECSIALRRVFIFDQHRSGQLIFARNQLVVRVEFVRDRILGGDALDAQHLFDLIPHTLRVLEQKGQMLTYPQTAAFLFVNEERAQHGTHALPLRVGHQLIERYCFHENPSSLYARARTSIG